MIYAIKKQIIAYAAPYDMYRAGIIQLSDDEILLGATENCDENGVKKILEPKKEKKWPSQKIIYQAIDMAYKRQYNQIIRILSVKMRKPLTSYMQFVTDIRDEVNQEMPEASFGEKGRRYGVLWHSLSDDQQNKYREKWLIDDKIWKACK